MFYGCVCVRVFLKKKNQIWPEFICSCLKRDFDQAMGMELDENSHGKHKDSVFLSYLGLLFPME